MGRILQNRFMVEEGNLPLGNANQAKVAPPMEHGALEVILPVDKGTKKNTSHF